MSAPKILQEPISRSDIVDHIEKICLSGKRTLIGVDCNFGYAQSVGFEQFGSNYTYKDLWKAVENSSKDIANYFAGGFWENPTYAKHFWTTGKKPSSFDINLRRVTEQTCISLNLGNPENTFKLIGSKQVGKGGLSGMRMAYYLKEKLKNKICFWPFEKESRETRVIVTEIYPRLFLKVCGLGNKKIKSSDDLNNALGLLKSKSIKTYAEVTDHQADAAISAAGLRYLCGTEEILPTQLVRPKSMTKSIAEREGWIFGVSEIVANLRL